MSKKVRILGLTGGIGSGKSTVASRFSQLGACVIDADKISRSLLEPNGACVDSVLKRFGNELLRRDGGIQRDILAKVVFSDPSARNDLNTIIHPVVKDTLFQETARAIRETPQRLVVWDVPLLFESGLDDCCDYSVAIICDPETRIQRVMERDGLDRLSVEQRIAAQMKDDERSRHANVTINNNSTLKELYAQVDKMFQLLTSSEV